VKASTSRLLRRIGFIGMGWFIVVDACWGRWGWALTEAAAFCCCRALTEWTNARCPLPEDGA